MFQPLRFTITFLIYTRLLPLAHNLINGIVIEYTEAACLKAHGLAFLSDFFKYGFVGITLDWIAEGMIEELRVLIEKLSFIMEGQIERAIDRVRSYNSHESSVEDSIRKGLEDVAAGRVIDGETVIYGIRRKYGV